MKIEVIWILTNLTFEKEITLKLFNCGVPSIVLKILQQHFIEIENRRLEEIELELLIDLLWLTANSANEDYVSVVYSNESLGDKLYQIAERYNK